MNNETETVEPVATQDTYKVGEYEFPGLACSNDGSITAASMLDVMLVALAALNNPAVNEILAANSILLKDKNGRVFFPNPNRG